MLSERDSDTGEGQETNRQDQNKDKREDKLSSRVNKNRIGITNGK
jgi:hypothetical protein